MIPEDSVRRINLKAVGFSALALAVFVPAGLALQFSLDYPGKTSLIVSDSGSLNLLRFTQSGAYYHIVGDYRSDIAGGKFQVSTNRNILASTGNHIHVGDATYETASTISAGTLFSGTYYVYYNTVLDSKARVAALNYLTGVGQAASGLEGKKSETREEKANGKASASMLGAGLSADYGRFTLNGVSGKNYSLPLSTSFKLSDRVRLDLGLPLIFTEIGNATAYGVGLTVGVPVDVFKPKATNGLLWRLTPSFGGTGASSRELATGGMIVNGGMTSLASYDFGKFAVSVGNHVSSYESTHAKFDGYRYEEGMSQRVFKNGVKVDAPIGQRWVTDVYAVHNKISGVEVLDQYMTYGFDLAYRIGGAEKKITSRLGYVSVGIKTDQGAGYRATNFQVGSGWKF